MSEPLVTSFNLNLMGFQPNYVPLLTNRSASYFEWYQSTESSDALDKALDDADRAIKLDRTWWKGWVLRGNCLSKKLEPSPKDISDMKTAYRNGRALAHDPQARQGESNCPLHENVPSP